MARLRVFFAFSGTQRGEKFAKMIAKTLSDDEVLQDLYNGVDCRLWNELDTRKGAFALSQPLFDALYRQLNDADFAIALFTPDQAMKNHRRTKPNVLYEYGLAGGLLGAERALLVQVGDAEIPSDLTGLLKVKLGAQAKPAAIADACERIRNTMLLLGPRNDDPATLLDIVNALTSARFDDVDIFNKTTSSRRRNDVDYLAARLDKWLERLLDPGVQRGPADAETRVYYAPYVGDGIEVTRGGSSRFVTEVRDHDRDGREQEAMFVISGTSLERGKATRKVKHKQRSEPRLPLWRPGRGIGRESISAEAFRARSPKGAKDLESTPMSNYETPGERSFYCVPVVAHHRSVAAAFGVLGASSSTPGGLDEDVRLRLRLVAYCWGKLLTDHLASPESPTQVQPRRLNRTPEGLSIGYGTGSKWTLDELNSAAEIVQLRRALAAHFVSPLVRRKDVARIEGSDHAAVLQLGLGQE